jgi:hypothetical protein
LDSASQLGMRAIIRSERLMCTNFIHIRGPRQVKLAVIMLCIWVSDAQDTCLPPQDVQGECDFGGPDAFCAAGTDNMDCCSTTPGLLGPFQHMKLDRDDLVESLDMHGVKACAAECVANPDYRSFNWLGAYGPHMAGGGAGSRPTIAALQQQTLFTRQTRWTTTRLMSPAAAPARSTRAASPWVIRTHR